MADDDKDTSEFKLYGRVGDGMAGIRIQDGVERLGVLVPITEGTPVPPELEIVRSERLNNDTLKLTTMYRPKGPGRVSSPKYRSNYDAIFGTKKATGKDLN